MKTADESENNFAHSLNMFFVDDMPSYVSRCKLIHLEPLHKRRLNSGLFFIFDLLKDNIYSPELFSMLRFNPPSRARLSNFFLPVKSRTNYGRFEPLSYMCRNFNILFRQGLYNINMSRDQFRNVCRTTDLHSAGRPWLLSVITIPFIVEYLCILLYF